MGKVVEIIGAPGSGKSELFDRLRRAFRGSNQQVFINSNYDSDPVFAMLVIRLCQYVQTKVLGLKCSRYNVKQAQILAAEFQKEFPECVESICDYLNLYVKSANVSNVLQPYFSFMFGLSVQRHALAKRFDGLVVVDEGLHHKIANCFSEQLRGEFRKLLDAAPAPAGLVLVEPGVQEHLIRVEKRQSLMYQCLEKDIVFSETMRKRAGARAVFEYYAQRQVKTLSFSGDSRDVDDFRSVVAWLKSNVLR